MAKTVWPDPDAQVSEMQSAEWYLSAVLTPAAVDLDKRKVEFDPKAALNLALKHAEQFRLQAWAHCRKLEKEIKKLKGSE